MTQDLRWNVDDLVEMAVTGQISQPAMRRGGYTPWPDGVGVMLPGMYGITYSARVGDRAFGWAGDHVEPGLSIAHKDERADFALHYLTCIGNEAEVVTGHAKGAKGIVTGEHARILVDFEPDALEDMTIGDTIQIRTVGRGIRLEDYPEIEFKKTSPTLAHALGLRTQGGKIHCPVAMELPPRIMGSGAELNAEFVDQDLMSGDRALMAELGIDQMRLGDLIGIRNVDHRFGRSYRAGWVAICICIHGDSVMTGHGPGIMTLMTGPADRLTFAIDSSANIAHTLGIRGQS
ncbi:MAG: DUF4438 domain-containing protein [Gemmatimonadota bacterium]|nr:DUF4438 domain-containing protein [Gemmatimonadota bacterium]MDE3006173.1 DUF4438 domain-containing protein [Gemmatimonadota bacterium]MDE3013904.1 DUF4438 domain-containing protein [Gemmatimonadota bacterium]